MLQPPCGSVQRNELNGPAQKAAPVSIKKVLDVRGVYDVFKCFNDDRVIAVCSISTYRSGDIFLAHQACSRLLILLIDLYDRRPATPDDIDHASFQSLLIGAHGREGARHACQDKPL